MLKRAVDATLNVDILSDATTFRVKTGVLWPNLVSYIGVYPRYLEF